MRSPIGLDRPPPQSAVLAFDLPRLHGADQRLVGRLAAVPTTISPEVPPSSRWTIPGRVVSPTVAISGHRSTSPFTNVPESRPAARVDDEPRRLVDHDHVLVLVDDAEDRLDTYRGRGRGGCRPTQSATSSILTPGLAADLDW